MTEPGTGDEGPDDPRPNRRTLILGGIGAVVVALLVVLGVVVATDDGDDGDTDVASDTTTSTTTTTTDPTSTTDDANTTTSTAAFEPAVDPYEVAYPSPLSSQRFESPDAAARSYATDVLGFTELVLGEFRRGDSRSGEVPVTDREGGDETVIILRQMEDDTWYVLGSQAQDIEVDSPEATGAIASPFETTGRALAFEGTVGVQVRVQTEPEPIGEGVVLGSGTPPAGPFEGEITFEPPAQEVPGVLVYVTRSAQDGRVLQATSFPVRIQP